MPEAHDPNVTILAAQTFFKGELSATGPVKILGQFEGAVKQSTELLVGANAQVTASLEGETVVVEGSVQGDILARQRLQLGPKAHVQGDITAASLTVAEGATFIGRVAVGGSLSGEPVQPTRKLTTESKSGASRPTVKVAADWATEPTPAGTDWLGQSSKTPGWVKAATE